MYCFCAFAYKELELSVFKYKIGGLLKLQMIKEVRNKFS